MEQIHTPALFNYENTNTNNSFGDFIVVYFRLLNQSNEQ